MEKNWTVNLIGQAKKAFRTLPNGTRETLAVFLAELATLGPQRFNWPNFGKLKDGIYHCHLKKGRPTYVVCWSVDKQNKIIEVYYAGTHEKAPY